MAITIDQVTEAYVKTRAEISELKELQNKRETYLLGQLQKLNLLNTKTEHGTVYQTVKESVTVADWDAVTDFVTAPAADAVISVVYGAEAIVADSLVDSIKSAIKSAMRLEFLNKAVNKTACLEQMGEKRDQPTLPGVNYSAIRTVGIRRS